MESPSSEPTKPLSELDPFFELSAWQWCGEYESATKSLDKSARTTVNFSSSEENNSESDSSSCAPSKFDSFPKPGTIPDLWDLSEM